MACQPSAAAPDTVCPWALNVQYRPSSWLSSAYLPSAVLTTDGRAPSLARRSCTYTTSSTPRPPTYWVRPAGSARSGDSQLSTRQWVAAVQAQALAGLGDLSGCQRSLDAAGRGLDLADSASPGGWLRFDGTRLGEERGTCYLALGRADLAENELNSALAGTASARRRGSILADLAMIGVQRKDTSQILHHADDAIDIAGQTHSAGYLGRKLTALQVLIQPLLATPGMAELNDRLSRLPAVT